MNIFNKIFLAIISYLLFVNVSAVTPKENLLSFDFQKISVSELIALISKYNHQNIILSSQIPNQEISLHLEQVHWNEALNLILSSQNLSQRKVGNTIIIAPINDIAQQLQQQFLLSEQEKQVEPLKRKIIHLHYAKAQDLAMFLKENSNGLLSGRGHVAFDLRSNNLWIEDTRTNMVQIQSLIIMLDQQEPQISIEARVVTIDSDYEKELGLRFGLSALHHLSGNLAGANELASGVPANSIPLSNRLNFDFSSTATSGSTGSIGLALAKIANADTLDLELSALEAEGAAEIIAKPSLVTENQQTAIIQTGEDIPYQEKTSSGATNVAFKKAVLSLEVTPELTADKHIELALHISQDKPSSKFINGVPAIDTREIHTQVLMNNNETLVLGGIYKETETHQMERIPFISNIPIIGSLFQHQHEEKKKESY